jgi:hypothetical protein
MTEELKADRKSNPKLVLLRTVGFYKNTPALFEHPFFPPAALGVLFSQLKSNGYEVRQDDLSIRVHRNIFDKCADIKFRHELFFQKERIIQYGKSGNDVEVENELEALLGVAGIGGADIFLLSIPESPSNPSNILFAIALAKFLKKKHSSYIVIGGDPPSVSLLNTQYDPSGIIDYIVIGKGEKAVLEVVDRIIYNKDNRKPGEVIVLSHLGGDTIVVPDFSGLPLEQYRLSFPDYKDFFSHEILKDFFASDTSMLLFQFTDGCPNKCAFCSSSGGRMGPMLNPEEVVDALARLQAKFNPTGYFFLSDTVNVSKAYIERICDLICERGLNILWTACARVNGLDEETIAKMRRSGCIRLVIGMETASPVLLRKVNKGITIRELEKVLQLAAKYGIWIGLEIICGLPQETGEDINATIEFLLENKEYIDMAYVAMFDLREGSLMHIHPQEYGIENIRELNLYKKENSDASNETNFVKFGFDEINGLRWDNKQKQMRDSFSRVRSAVHTTPYPNPFLGEHLLFYLYSKFKDKSVVKQTFYELAKHMK